MRILGFVTGETAACDSSKVIVNGKTYEGTEEVYGYLKKENMIGYKLFVICDVVHRIPIYWTSSWNTRNCNLGMNAM